MRWLALALCVWPAALAAQPAASASPASPWTTAASGTAMIEALIHANLPVRARALVPLVENLPPPLVDEVTLRAALERGDRRDLERQLQRQGPSPTATMARAVLALERGLNGYAENLLRIEIEKMKGAPRRPRWELGILRATAMFRQGRMASALQELIALPEGDERILWSPYVQLLSMTEPEDPDRRRMLARAVDLNPESPDVHFHALKQALFADDPAAGEQAFLKHARTRFKRTARSRWRRFSTLPTFPGPEPAGTPQSADVYAEFARLAVARDRNEHALLCEQAAQTSGQTPFSRWMFARTRMMMADFESARKTLEELAPRYPAARVELGWLQAWNGEPVTALATLEGAPPVRAGDPTLLLARARALADSGDGAAEKLLEEHVALLGQNPQYWLIRAIAAHRRGDTAGRDRALTQVSILRRMGRIGDGQVLYLGTMLKPTRWNGFMRKLSEEGQKAKTVQFDARPAGFSALTYRLMADRASIIGEGRQALALLEEARAAMRTAVIGRLGMPPSALDPTLERFLPRLARETAYPIALVVARVLMQVGEAPRAIDELRPYLADSWTPSVPFFLLMASAAGQAGDRARTNLLASAGTLLGVRGGTPWGAYAQLLVLIGADEALHALARAARAYTEPADNPDEAVAVAALGGLAADALTLSPAEPGRGTDLGHGLAHLADGRLDAARPTLARAAAEASMWQAPAQGALVELELAAGRISEAAAVRDAMIRERPNDMRSQLADAQVAFARGRLDEAAAALERARARAPYAAGVHLLAAQLASKRGASPRPHLEEAVRVAPHVARAWEELARAPGTADPRAALGEAARQALDAGELTRARRVLRDLAARPPLPAPKSWPRCDPRALGAAFEKLVGAQTAGSGPALELGREAALLLVELGDPAGASRLLERGLESGPGSRMIGVAAPPAAPLGKEAAAALLALVLLAIPAIAGRRLRAAAERA